MTDQTRKAFEAWFTNGIVGLRLTCSDGAYTLMTAQTSWIAWQAATAAERERCALVCDARQKVTGYQLGPNTDCADAIRQGGAL